jgi:multiple sugar transport system ATP-binding protein
VAEIVLDGISKVYPDGTRAVTDLDLEIPDGELTVLVGPSGCGKSTVLLMVAGLEEVTEGTIRIGDEIVNDVLPRDRDIAMVFQNYALYPHMTVYKNMAFGLRMRKTERGEIDRRVRDAARILGLTDDLMSKRPKQLSGGQRQRVAMGRAMVRDPRAFLMDEPLSNLDAKLRVEMRAEIAELQRALGVTTIYVTHDQTEAMVLGHHLALMNAGTLQQVGRPQDVYDAPANLFVASFIGSPAMNLAEADLALSNGSTTLEFGGQRLRAPEQVFDSRPALRSYAGKKVIVGIRPEDLEDASFASEAPPDRRLRVSVSLRESMGPEAFLHFPIGSAGVPIKANGGGTGSNGTANGLPETTFVARVTARTKARDGDDLELVVDTDALHFFDPATGDRIST